MLKDTIEILAIKKLRDDIASNIESNTPVDPLRVVQILTLALDSIEALRIYADELEIEYLTTVALETLN